MIGRRVWLLLPAFDEEGNLGPLLEDVRKVAAAWPAPAPHVTVVVVDDGSRDNTLSVAREPRPGLDVTVIPHGVNQGLGAAMRTGIGHVLEHGTDDDVLFAMDADHTHPPESMPRMCWRFATVRGLSFRRSITMSRPRSGMPIWRTLRLPTGTRPSLSARSSTTIPIFLRGCACGPCRPWRSGCRGRSPRQNPRRHYPPRRRRPPLSRPHLGRDPAAFSRPRSSRSEERTDAVECGLDVLETVRVGKPYEPLAEGTEAGARDRRHACVVQEHVLRIPGGQSGA